MSEKQPKRLHWSVPILAFACGIPIVGALLVTLVTFLLLNSTGTVHIGWSSVWAILFSIFGLAIVFGIVFILGAVYSLRLMFRMMGGVLGDAFAASPKPGQGRGANPLDAVFLRVARWGIPPGAAQSRQARSPGARGVVVDAEPPFSQEQTSVNEPPDTL